MSKKMMKRTAALSALIAISLSGTVFAAPTDNLTLDTTDNWYKDIITTDTTYVDDVKLNDNDIGNRLIKGATGNEVVYIDGTDVNLGFGPDPSGVATWARKANIENVSKIVLKGQLGSNAFVSSHGNGGDGAGTITIKDVGSIEQAEGSFADVVFGTQGGHIDINVGSITLNNFANAIYAQTGSSATSFGGTVSIVANNVNLSSTGTSAVISASNMSANTTDKKNTVTIKADNITIDAPNAVAIRSVGYFDNTAGNCEVALDADTVVIDAKTAVLAKNGSADDSAKVSIDAKNITITSTDYAVQAEDNANVQIGGTAKFESADITGNISSADNSDVAVNLGEEGSLNGNVTTGTGSTTDLNIGKDSTWTSDADSNLTNLTNDGGNIVMNGDGQTITADNFAGDGGTVTTNSLNNKLNAANSSATNTTVQGTTALTQSLENSSDPNAVNNALNALANVVDTAQGTAGVTTVALAEGALLGATSATVGANGATNVITKENIANAGLIDMTALSFMAWRGENDDLNERLGDLRSAKQDRGIWTRVSRAQQSFNTVTNQYNMYQIGYDQQAGDWTIGAAYSYTDGKSWFEKGTGENTHNVFSLYGTKMNNNGSFIDVVAKYGNLDYEYTLTGGVGDGDYDTDAYSFSVETGKRITSSNGVWVEPQLQLTYGTVDNVAFATKNGYSVNMDSADSFVARAGIMAGKPVYKGNIYLKASYLYDFAGEVEGTFSNGTRSVDISRDLGGGWWEVGAGANFNLSDATHLYLDFEKAIAGEAEVEWKWNAGVRYSF